LLSDKIFKNASNVEWAPNKTKAVIEFSNQTKIVYDFNTDKQITLPSHWEDFTFSPDSKKLINKSLGTDSNNNWLVVSNSDGSQTKSLEKIEASNNSIIPYWSPNNQSVAMYTKSLDINKKEVIFIGEYGQSFKSIIVEGQDFQPQWSQNGEKLLYSVSSPKNGLKPNLWIVNANGDQTGTSRKNLGLETWAEKCVFVSNSEVYCAVPKYIENSSGIFSETAMVTSDDLYKINIETGQKTLIAIPDQNYNISSNQSNLFFTDGSSEEIHKINLQN
jgi:Tol biopolymer transport system component